MRIGIVGSEAAKFTAATEAQARALIRSLLHEDDIVVSGHCHLGGIDLWAVQEAIKLGLDTREFPPKSKDWAHGYKPRNIQIAEASDRVVCITLAELPPGYTGTRFPLCYHCGTRDHVKSGGCWTVKYAREKLGKTGEVLVIRA